MGKCAYNRGMTNPKLTGTITTFLVALNHPEVDEEVQTVIGVLGESYETETYNDTEVEEKYLSAPAQGLELLLNDGILNTIFIYAAPTDENEVFSDWEGLIDGLNGDSAREEIRSILGEPVKTATLYDLYQLEDRFIHFEFDESSQRLNKLTLMAKDPLINSLTDLAEVSSEARVEGTINTLIAAIGHSEQDFETQAVIELFESEYIKSEPSGGPDVVVQYLKFPAGHIQFKNDVVANVFFSTGLSFGDFVPEGLRIHSLIAGIAEKPARNDIPALLGNPYVKQVNFELYNVGGASVHVEYINDVPDSISVSAMPVKEKYQ